MNYKTGRANHDFQIAYFLLGSCHTPDAAYALATDLLADRVQALSAARVSAKRALAKKLTAERAISKTEDGSAERLEAEADLEECENGSKTSKWLVEQAEREEAFVRACIERLQPLRKYAHLPDHDAFEAAQRDEWREEMMHRCENYMASQGFIPHDELATMRAHPDFESVILPKIESIHSERKSGTFTLSKPSWSLPVLLTNDNQLRLRNAAGADH